MEEGDVLVMLTDGFFEWARPIDNEQFGIGRLEQALRSTANADAPTILRVLDQTVRGFCSGSPQSDDMTAIVIKRNARSMADIVPDETIGQDGRVEGFGGCIRVIPRSTDFQRAVH
jgi:hypothetical protein